MNQELAAYIKTKRKAGLKDDEIRTNLVNSGWQPEMVDAGLKADLDSDVPLPPPISNVTQSAPVTNLPIAVTNVASTRGIEYVIMFIALWITATSLGFLLHAAVDALSDNTSGIEGIAPYASAAMFVALPIFAYLFLRLKKAESSEPLLSKDPSRTRAIQLTLIVTFLIGIVKIIGYIFSLINGGGTWFDTFTGGSLDDTTISPIFNLIHTAITLVIAGGIFAYYWRDIHKKAL